jgi:hypothetical protein
MLQEIEKASMCIASGSGRYEQYLGNCLFMRDANKSISGLKANLFIAVRR